MSTNGQQENIDLERVEMWCARFYGEAREGAMLALASGDLMMYRTLSREKYEWLSAVLVVHGLLEK
jgi:hypothetical protein